MTPPTPRESLRVAVASDQSLIAEAVRMALTSRGHDAVVIRWPGDAVPHPRAAPRPRSLDAGLLLSDLDRWSRVRAAEMVLGRIKVPWLALTTAPRGPAWGAVLEAGARLVLPSTTRLDRIVDVLVEVVQGRAATTPDERADLLAQWRRRRDRRDQIADRLARLTPREHEVLRLLYLGESVTHIAAMLEVAPTTVRSQVKSILRKMDVNSQLSAVVAYRDASDVFGSSAPDGPGTVAAP
jgi:DNA-binding NarL/FixJ family response regulator